jgi:hypothetical protein
MPLACRPIAGGRKVVRNEPFDRGAASRGADMMTVGDFKPAALSNLVLEQGLLGAILNSNGVFDVIEQFVLAEDFAEPLHAQLFATIAETRERGGLVTLPLVIAAMGGYDCKSVCGKAGV